jgi:serine/threonine-protein kinase
VAAPQLPEVGPSVVGAVVDPDPARLATAANGDAIENPIPGSFLQAKLTRSGALLGTPAYMAAEQFTGKGCDARADQFSFSVALWEALHGMRPFGGSNRIQLMVSVACEEVREPPPDTPVPGWIRKVLLRGLRADPAQRYPSMAALLEALGRDRTVRRRRWIAVAAGVVLLAATGASARRLGGDRRALCTSGHGRATTAWGPERRRAVEQAFAASGNGNAAHAFATTAALMDEYVRRWSQLYTETCEATHVRGDQSEEVLDLRMDCLGERLASVSALGEVLSNADAQVVDNAVAAASAIPMLDRCSDVAMLRAVVRPPEDPATRARVAALREDLAKVTALQASGRCERAAAAGEKLVTAASALAYQPLVAEALLAVGRLGENCSDPVKATGQLEEASFVAEMSHHDQVAVEASLFVSGLYAERLHDLPTARRWLRHGEVLLARFPGHPIFEAWMMSARSILLLWTGQAAAGIEEARRALVLQGKVRGPVHMDVAICLQNLGLALYESGRFVEAEGPTARALELMTKLFGNASARTATLLVNYGEILTALHRFDDARSSIEQALAIWRNQNASPFFIGYGLLDKGRLALEAGDSTGARAVLLEAGRTLGEARPHLAPDLDFALARAFWAEPADRSKAVRLARRARQTLTGASRPRKLADIDAWLATHAGGNQ